MRKNIIAAAFAFGVMTVFLSGCVDRADIYYEPVSILYGGPIKPLDDAQIYPKQPVSVKFSKDLKSDYVAFKVEIENLGTEELSFNTPMYPYARLYCYEQGKFEYAKGKGPKSSRRLVPMMKELKLAADNSEIFHGNLPLELKPRWKLVAENIRPCDLGVPDSVFMKGNTYRCRFLFTGEDNGKEKKYWQGAVISGDIEFRNRHKTVLEKDRPEVQKELQALKPAKPFRRDFKSAAEFRRRAVNRRNIIITVYDEKGRVRAKVYHGVGSAVYVYPKILHLQFL